MRYFVQLIPTLVDMAKQLDRYNQPIFMVHGDFARRNIGCKEYDGIKQKHVTPRLVVRGHLTPIFRH
ncbi:unnamed protein product [Chondrus crispus]|uniref:Uncharacterized protein n=1 Tax=Chondrus crispus TaxID=2769 RepID=S0F371_CHOCR|nr:unnamed protein product [Chondrus crispus]CDF77467.1 unnamed protein product [Chondrus crispus]|eukprot:XP_005712341.1 unnamed protein product [Chondrus crispus]